MADHVEVLRLVDELFRKVLPKFNWSSDDFDAAGLTRDEVDLLNALPNLVQTRLRALSPAGVSKECDRQLALYRKFVNDLDDSTEYARAVITRSELRKMFADLTAALQDDQRNVE